MESICQIVFDPGVIQVGNRAGEFKRVSLLTTCLFVSAVNKTLVVWLRRATQIHIRTSSTKDRATAPSFFWEVRLNCTWSRYCSMNTNMNNTLFGSMRPWKSSSRFQDCCCCCYCPLCWLPCVLAGLWHNYIHSRHGLIVPPGLLSLDSQGVTG